MSESESADMSEDLLFADTLSGLVYEGVWTKHIEGGLQRTIRTLRDTTAIFVLACFTALLTFSQSRTWVLGRYFILSKNQVVRLDNDNTPEPLAQLSQEAAVLETARSVKYCISRLGICLRRILKGDQFDSDFQPDEPIIFPRFGLFACLNITLFLTMGVLIPLRLSEGTFGAPVV